MFRIYFDLCCLGRPFDDQTQTRIKLETEAVVAILCHIEAGRWEWVGSHALEIENEDNADINRRERLEELLSLVNEMLPLTEADRLRVDDLRGLGIKDMDAYHIAVAERAKCALFLTTDNRLLRKAERHGKLIRVLVKNPLDWLKGIS